MEYDAWQTCGLGDDDKANVCITAQDESDSQFSSQLNPTQSSADYEIGLFNTSLPTSPLPCIDDVECTDTSSSTMVPSYFQVDDSARQGFISSPGPQFFLQAFLTQKQKLQRAELAVLERLQLYVGSEDASCSQAVDLQNVYFHIQSLMRALNVKIEECCDLSPCKPKSASM